MAQIGSGRATPVVRAAVRVALFGAAVNPGQWVPVLFVDDVRDEVARKADDE